MSEFKYPFIGRGTNTGRVVLFERLECGLDLLGGRRYSDWNMSTFEDITKEYLTDTWGKVESKEHADFIIELAKNAGFDILRSSDEFFSFSDESVVFLSPSHVAKQGCKEISIPNPTKTPPVSTVNRDIERHKETHNQADNFCELENIRREIIKRSAADAEACKNANPYHRTLHSIDGHKVVTDVYRVLDAFGTGSAEIDHAVKKLLCGGLRGSKGKLQDYSEAIKSIEAAIKLAEQKELLK